MAEPDSESEKLITSYPLLEVMTQEFKNYLDATGVSESLIHVLKLLYDLDEKPDDPLEFMRVHFIKFVPERKELGNLQEEYDTVMKQIAALQQENSDMKRKLKSNSEDNLENEELIVSITKYDNNMENVNSIT